MVIQGHVENGMIIPHSGVSLPDGTEVTITVRAFPRETSQAMSDAERKRYLEALARIDAVPNEKSE